mmetsp:Transcript_3843/g.10943  ORF Transcript_3843/g.10943 Transcript_3843/m.10943 type:complete len:245 (+) Transcript_3843:566-1300(+)
MVHLSFLRSFLRSFLQFVPYPILAQPKVMQSCSSYSIQFNSIQFHCIALHSGTTTTTTTTTILRNGRWQVIGIPELGLQVLLSLLLGLQRFLLELAVLLLDGGLQLGTANAHVVRVPHDVRDAKERDHPQHRDVESREHLRHQRVEKVGVHLVGVYERVRLVVESGGHQRHGAPKEGGGRVVSDGDAREGERGIGHPELDLQCGHATVDKGEAGGQQNLSQKDPPQGAGLEHAKHDGAGHNEAG